MTKPTITIHNVETNEIVEREMNAEELAQWEFDQAKIAQDAAQAQTKAAAKASAEGKLAALGLTADEVSALLG